MHYMLILLAVIPSTLEFPVPIVGGTKARLIPYQVSIERLFSHSCGGSIITPRIILTAAHCMVYPIYPFLVRAGSRTGAIGGQLHRVNAYFIHPNYNKETFDYDVAVLHLENSLKFNKRIDSIPLANANEALIPGAMATISGWGRKKEGTRKETQKLRIAQVPIGSKAACQNITEDVTDRQICAGYHNGMIDACHGDSGGPLVANGKLFGVISAGRGCGRQLGLYTSIPVVRLWIDQAILTLETKN